jgi:hypothetical protein
MNRPKPLRPDRLRTIEKPFAWIPFRLLRGGFFQNLSDQAKLLYLFLCLAADRQGISFYGDAKIKKYFQLDQTGIDRARKELIQKDLLAYDGRLYQVLALPTQRNGTQVPSPNTSKPERFSDILKRLADQVPS